jgi:hypothetical protein
MSDGGDKLDRVLEHILDLKEAMARLEGAELPKRVEKLEEHAQKNRVAWAKVAGAATVGGGIIHLITRKFGL